MSRASSPSPQARVFVIEDDPAVRDSLIMVLNHHGVLAEGYESGSAFFAAVKPRDKDTIILDLSLPGLSGAEVAAVLRSRGCKARIAVISGLRASAFQREVDRIAPIAAFRKPLDTQKLLDAVAPGRVA